MTFDTFFFFILFQFQVELFDILFKPSIFFGEFLESRDSYLLNIWTNNDIGHGH